MKNKQMSNENFKNLIQPLIPRWESAPDNCPECDSDNLQRSVIPIGGPYSGSIHCPDCGHRESVMNYLGRTMIKVEPLEDK